MDFFEAVACRWTTNGRNSTREVFAERIFFVRYRKYFRLSEQQLELANAAINMGIQFISFPMEVPGQWRRIEELLEVPDDLERTAMYRISYLPETTNRPTMDCSRDPSTRAPKS